MASTSTNLPLTSEASYIRRDELQEPSGATVRSNGLLFLRSSWQSISRASKFMLVSSVFFIVSQIIVSIVILVIYQNDTCDKPLDTYLVVYSVRIGCLLPLLIYQYLERPALLYRQRQLQQRQQQYQQSRQQQQQQQRQQQQEQRADHTVQTSDITESSQTIHEQFPVTSDHPMPLTMTPGNNNHSDGRNAMKEWCERLKSLLDLFGILWFIVGNYLIFTSENCSYLARGLYYTIMAWVLLGYLIILIPVILCASVIFCLPCVLVILRLVNIVEIPGMVVGASQEEILKVPVYRYDNQGQAVSTGETSEIPLKPRVPWTRRLFLRFRKDRHDIEAKSYPPITIPNAEDALCSICLSEYETGDLICKLWCGHHFHKDCVHEWLGLNSLCPLCKQNFRGKDYNEGDDSPTELPFTTESRT